MGQNQLPVDSFLMQQGGTLTWSQSRMDGSQTLRQDVPTQVIAQNLTFEGFHPIHLMGINDVDMMQGTGSSLTTEPLKKIYDVRTRTRHQTESFNPFTLTFGYSQQQQDYRLHEETYTPTTAHQMDMTLSETCDLVGFQAKGSGNVSITAPTITLKSVQDVRQEETQTKGFSTSTNLSTGIYEALISIATQTTYQNKSTKDEVKQVTQPSGFDMGGTVALKAETFTNIGGSVQKQGTTIIAQNQLTQGLPNVHHHSEKTCIPSSLIRLAFDGIPLSQSIQEFVQTLQPSTPSENFKSDLYMALDEEGVEPIQSVEIMTDPEVQQVVEDTQLYTSKKQAQRLEKQKKTIEKLEDSVPNVTQTLESMSPSALEQYVISPEAFVHQLHQDIVLADFAKRRPDLAPQIEKTREALLIAQYTHPLMMLIQAHQYTQEHQIECMVNLALLAMPTEWVGALGVKYLSPVVMPVLEKTGLKMVGSSVKNGVTTLLKSIAEKSTPITTPIRNALSTIAQKMGLKEVATESGELAGYKSAFWEEPEMFTFNNQTNKVYQRSDLIDPNRTDLIGRTSLDLMKKGKAPIGPDGKPIHLHHMLQTQDGPLAMMTQTFHEQYTRIIHINPKSMASGINRIEFNTWRSEFWKDYARELERLMK